MSARYDDFCVGDWLINYQGGYNRRGLIGEAFYDLATVTNTSPRFLVFSIIVFSYLVIFTALLSALNASKYPNALKLFAITSPFTILWPLWHTTASYRKELLLLAVGYLSLRWFAIDALNKKSLTLWGVVLCILVMIHDGLFFFVPLLVLAASRSPSDLTPARFLLLIVPPLFTFSAGYYFTSGVNTDLIRESLANIEEGSWSTERATLSDSIAWLDGSILDGVESVIHRYSHPREWVGVIIGVFGMLLTFLTFKAASAAMITSNIRNLLPVIVSSVFLLFLFAVSSDWNRWLYVATSLLSIMLYRVILYEASEIGELQTA